MADPTLSWQAAKAAGARFKSLFARTHLAWQICGHVRRQADGPRRVVHLVVPRDDPDSGYANAVWARAVELLTAGTLELHTYPGRAHRGPEWDSSAAGFDLDGWHHEVSLSTVAGYGCRLAELTGPRGYWLMLLHRLTLSGALRVRGGRVCLVDRSGVSERLVVLPTPVEATFFKLARTPYRDPRRRFERPAGGGGWERGMLPEWYPAGATVYADPARSPHLFDRSRSTPAKYVGRDWRRWTHG